MKEQRVLTCKDINYKSIGKDSIKVSTNRKPEKLLIIREGSKSGIEEVEAPTQLWDLHWFSSLISPPSPLHPAQLLSQISPGKRSGGRNKNQPRSHQNPPRTPPLLDFRVLGRNYFAEPPQDSTWLSHELKAQKCVNPELKPGANHT